MIKLTGSLTVKTINGRNGPFNVGRLDTDIGEFNVKEGIVEFDPGQYAGEFTISRIHPASYVIGGRSVVEVRAVVHSIALTDLDTSVDDAPEKPLTEPEPETQTEPLSDDKKLFGDLWPLGDKVKLDSTVDRDLLRQQVIRLKEDLGYEFQPVGRFFEKVDRSKG